MNIFLTEENDIWSLCLTAGSELTCIIIIIFILLLFLPVASGKID